MRNEQTKIRSIELVDTKVRLDEMMYDPNNPRFCGKNINQSATEIEEKTWRMQEFKELLKSMERGIVWINKMVIVAIADLPEEILQTLSEEDKRKYKYVVIEGNTRLACLRHEKLNLNKDDEISVIIIKRNGCSDADFLLYLASIQSKANILVVKEWNEVAKFKHVYNVYKRNVKLGEKTFKGIMDEITPDAGGKESEVKKAIFRCMIAEAIAAEVDDLADEDWGYLEAFERSASTRRTVGVGKDYQFLWEDSDELDFSAEREMIRLIPQMVQSAKSANINSKSFRDGFSQMVSECQGNTEDIVERVKVALDDDSGSGWRKRISDQEEWKKEIKKIDTKLRKFPSNENWAGECKEDLQNLFQLLKRIIDQVGE